MVALFNYVGPVAIRLALQGAPTGMRINSANTLADWLRHHKDDDGGWVTYVISADGNLLIAPRRSEHVACAGGGPVLAAGEMRLDSKGVVTEVTNNSTGFCPAEDCWPAVRSALDSAGLEHPGEFTFVAVFRRCSRCGSRNLVKDHWFVCAICNADLSPTWNFDVE